MINRKDKIFVFTVGLYVAFAAFAIYCIVLLVKTQYFDDIPQPEKNDVNAKILLAHRADIISSDHKTLSANEPLYSLFVDFGLKYFNSRTIDPSKVVIDKDKKKAVSLDTLSISVYKQLSSTLQKFVGGKPANSYYNMLYNYRIKAENRENKQKGYSIDILGKDIDIFTKDSIFRAPLLRKYSKYRTGVYSEERMVRRNPYGNMAHSVIGSFNEEGGVSGIEYLYNDALNSRNNIISTIDTKLQDICETLLREKLESKSDLQGGVVILMETTTGDIKAMANLDYDARNKKYYDTYNYAVKRTIDPGSTFKTVSLMLSLETGKVKITDKINCDEGSREIDERKVWNGVPEVKNKQYGELAISDIIAQSINIGTAKMVAKAFPDGKDFVKGIQKLGILDSLYMSESKPYVMTPEASSWTKNSMYAISHGYQMRLAPIHIVTFYNSIANNGVMVRPRIVNGIKYNTGEEKIFKPHVLNHSVCSESTLDGVRRVLSRVVSTAGTASRASGTHFGIAGKTGTAQILLDNNKYSTPNGERKIQASFCGFFPEKNPEYTCIVVLYSKLLPKNKDLSASEHAVPLMKKIANKIYMLDSKSQRKYIASNSTGYKPVLKNTSAENLAVIAKEFSLPLNAGNNKWVYIDTANNSYKASELILQNNVIPNVTGMGLRDAINILENRGLRVSFKGVGKVDKQIPEQGTPLHLGQKVVLELK